MPMPAHRRGAEACSFLSGLLVPLLLLLLPLLLLLLLPPLTNGATLALQPCS